MEADSQGGPLKRLFSKRVMAIGAVLLLAVFFIRPPVNRVRWRVSQSISLALGRRVQIGSLHLRFLPQLGFELENFVIYDDARFGAEPLLRSSDVTASLRVTALLRGRIEISNLSLSEASLNLARDPQGKWNVEDLVERTAKISAAPTASTKRESRPRFPYIEAKQARINFKIGAEKTHFAFTDAQFALWQESENTWGMRLKAQPIRTDANLTDTGVINLSGLWQRAATPEQTPVSFAFEWKQAQIGQVSKLVSGSDRGWRGNVLLSGSLAGTLGHLQITADTSVDDFRRHNVLDGEDLRLAAHCAGEYSAPGRSLSNLDCSAPIGDGLVELKGEASGMSSYRFSFAAIKVPAQSALALARHSRTGVPVVAMDGSLNAGFVLSRRNSSDPIKWTGSGEIEDVTVRSTSAQPALNLGRVPFVIASEEEPRLDVGPVNVALGRPTPLLARASIFLAGYQVSLRGDAGLKRLLQSAQMLGIPSLAAATDGNSTVDLSLAGNWADTERPMMMGTAQLRSVHSQVRGLNAPLEIRSANLVLGADSVKVQNLNASAAGGVWRGSLVIPRPCFPIAACAMQFNLHAAEVSATALNDLLNPLAGKRSWYKFLSLGAAPTPYLLQAHASGRIVIDQLAIGTTSATQLAADVTLEQGKLALTNFRGEVLGGKIAGEWKADFMARPPIYKGSGRVDGVSLDRIADLMHDGWIDGTGSAGYQFKTVGWGLQDVIQAADLVANFTVKDSDFPHVVLSSKVGPLQSSLLAGTILLKDGNFSFQDTKLESASGIYKLSGTASLTGALNLKMISETAAGYDVSGTLAKTRVSQLPSTATQAALKP